MAQEVNNVRFGNFSIGSSQSGKAKEKQGQVNEGATNTAQEQTQSTFKPDSLLNAMGTMSAYNMISINKSEAQAVNPSDYLDEGRISDIEAMMAEFEAGVDEIALSIEDEFPEMFSQEQKYALAADIFARE